jgi:hypothetical protein
MNRIRFYVVQAKAAASVPTWVCSSMKLRKGEARPPCCSMGRRIELKEIMHGGLCPRSDRILCG